MEDVYTGCDSVVSGSTRDAADAWGCTWDARLCKKRSLAARHVRYTGNTIGRRLAASVSTCVRVRDALVIFVDTGFCERYSP